MADSSQRCRPVPPSTYHHTGIAPPAAGDGVSAHLEHPLDSSSRLSLPQSPSYDSAHAQSQLHVNGLKLKLQGQANLFATFSYALYPLMDKCVPVDWKPLVIDDVESQHIRCHELQEGDELSMLVANFKAKHAKALILINTQDNYSIASQFLEGMTRSNFPTVIVSHLDGIEILNLLDEHGDNVFARLDVSGEQDWAIIRQAIESSQSKSMNGQRMPHDLDKGPSFSFKSEFKKLLFSADKKPLIVSGDRAKLIKVMAVISSYEKEVDEPNFSHVKKTMKKIKKHFDKLYVQDLPFYVAVFHQFSQRRKLYQCYDLISACLTKIESLKPEELAQTFNDFFKRGDFEVTCWIPDKEESRSVSMFWFMECACMALLKISFNLHTQDILQQSVSSQRTLHPKFCYSNMIWISLALKFRSVRTQVLTTDAKVWYERFINFHHRITLSATVMEDIVNGLKFGKLLDLPKEFLFNFQHLANLVVSDRCIRPFQHLLNFIRSVEGFVSSEDKLFYILAHIRATYTTQKSEPTFTTRLSLEGTLAGTITEAISFLDFLVLLWEKHKFREEVVNSECVQWLQLLIDMVDVTGKHPEALFKKFFLERAVCKKHQGFISKQIVAAAHKKMRQLGIEEFFTLYKALNIWPNHVVEEYLSNCIIPAGMKINMCKEFLSEVVTRFPEAHMHIYLLDFLEKVAARYKKDNCVDKFIFDLLLLRVPKLFSVPCESSNSQSLEQAKEIRQKFTSFLTVYILKNALQQAILRRRKDVFNAISEDQNEFQYLILGVLHQEMIPDSKSLQKIGFTGSFGADFRSLLQYSTEQLITSSWPPSLSARQSFCWGLVASCCSHIHINKENLDWLKNNSYIISELSRIFNDYCTRKRLTSEQCVIIQDLPEDISRHSSNDVKRYFKWISSMQSVIHTWKIKFENWEVNYDEILMYVKSQLELDKLCRALCSHSLIVKDNAVRRLKDTFHAQFVLLNSFLLKCVPRQSDAKWCSFLVLLKDYGVVLPQHLIANIETYVVFPDKVNGIRKELLRNPVVNSEHGCSFSLQLNKDLSLKQLMIMVDELKKFHDPLHLFLDMLTFFKLNYSVMFDKYLRSEILQVIRTEKASVESQSATHSAGILSLFELSAPIHDMVQAPSTKSQGGVSVSVLKHSLQKTKELLIRIMRGEATYVEIIARGELDLEKLDIEKEFVTLVKFATISEIRRVGSKDHPIVYSLLELFQYTKHVQNICEVCEQYHLQGCLQDEQLEELQSLVNDVKLEENRSKLTPNEASKRMTRIKVLLCIDRGGNSPEDTPKKLARLAVFPTVANSAEFYQFIHDKHFYGEEGQATFQQQYQLVTTQLQHEEYQEYVLNHLLAAFNLITPFMDDKQSFKTLMTKVTSLDTTFRLKQLETVNANITLIQLWFSRAEGDTLQNVAKELDKVLELGYYSFKLPIDGDAQLILDFLPSTSQTPGTVKSDESSATTAVSQILPHSELSEVEEKVEQTSELTKIEPKFGDVEARIRKTPKQEQWNSEQIGDFVRKLGFMDTEKEGGEKIKHFRHISAIAYRLLELYRQLKDLGNPHYCRDRLISLPCSIARSKADNRVKETEATLEDWRKRVTELRSQYDWLLFFSIPKILRLYKLLSGSEDCEQEEVDKIVCEISFLCQNDVSTRNTLKKIVQKQLETCIEDIRQGIPPMQVVGEFLGALFKHRQLQLLRRRSLSPLDYTNNIITSHSQEKTQLLHYCPCFTQCQLIQTVIGICSGVPEAFEVFRCRPSTTEGELSLFLRRAAHHSLQCIVLEVNKLPFNLQENLMQLNLLVQATEERQEKTSPELTSPGPVTSSCIHFIETKPSVLRDVPWIQLREQKEPCMSFEATQKTCRDQCVKPKDFAIFELVVGAAGDGKTHYIKKQLQASPVQLTIAVNEAFTPLKAITKLLTLPISERKVSIYFNFTMLPPGDSVDESECERFEQLMEVIGWFFFDLLILGYVEDPATGKSFRIPGGMEWAIYIEVPSRKKGLNCEETMKLFCEEVPTLCLLGKTHIVKRELPYDVDDDVQLVCKYLQAYDKGGFWGIDRLYRDGGRLVKFSLEQDLSAQNCHNLLHKHMPEHIRSTKISQRLFIKYMKRRCEFLDNFPAFNYNTGGGEFISEDEATDTNHLGSTLMRTMLREVNDFCDPTVKANWSVQPHQQLIYDYKDFGASFGLVTLHPQKLPEEEKAIFKKIGIVIPSMLESYYSRDVLDEHLSRALNIQLKNKRLTAIDDSAYVLTLDYTIKMLNIHERYECGVPVIIEGETGVGKTALIEMLSNLWNQSLLLEWEKQRDRIREFFAKSLGDMPSNISPNYHVCVQAVEHLNNGQDVSEDQLLTLCQLPDHDTNSQLYTQVQTFLNQMGYDPVVAQLTLEGSQFKDDISLDQLFMNAKIECAPETTANLLHAVFCAKISPTFYKINVHTAMTPAEIRKYFIPVIEQAEELRDFFYTSKARFEKEESMIEKESVASPQKTEKRSRLSSMSSAVSSLLHLQGPPVQERETEKKKFMHKMPFVTVFLDEVNTSSCMGLFKEIIVDRTFDGEPIPENVFIVAACNPHRGNSMASLGIQGGSESDGEKWVRGTYYVRKLHPTLKFLMWDYGSLDEHQEKEYINAKMRMLNKDLSNPEVANLADLIVGSQNQMRKYAFEQIRGTDPFAKISSRSCVSQRDIQRVFTFFQWFNKIYEKLKQYGDCTDYNRRAILVALGIVYYMRLNNQYREEYKKFIDKECRLPGKVTFTKTFSEELNWYIKSIKLPKGIARTQALKENVLAIIVCTVTHTPLIIVGAPGSSKTLSFNQTIANLKGAESKVKIFRDTSIFHALDPHFYQCSRRTTSNEVETVFSRAINRQRAHAGSNLPINCVVFMDEAGLPEESHESLKVLHYHLDKQEVSFVAISNHVLDASKTNRAVSLFRPEASDDDLKTLAKGCFCSNPDDPPHEIEGDLDTVVSFCKPYSKLMGRKSFSRFFGLRDFIHFVNYLRHKCDENQSISPQVVMQALERNFNGSGSFEAICKEFLGNNYSKVKQRGILDILQASLQDRPQEKQDLSENEVRYKLIIDPSEDDSLVRLLFTFGILKRDNTRIFVCSNFPADSHLQKINTIAAIRHSAVEGHTVVMSQTDDIHESFYDLFNQRFRRIDDPNDGPRYYTNVAIGAHLRPCRVHPNFQCVIVLKKSEIENTPSPFLNRFEKYLITHQTILETALDKMPSNMAIIIRAAMNKVKDFLDLISGSESLYGLCPYTLNSLVISLLPSVDHTYQCEKMGDLNVIDHSLDVRFYIIEKMLQVLRECTGLLIPKQYTEEEFSLDVNALFNLVLLDPKFKGLMHSMTHLSAAQAIPEAIKVLHSDIGPDKGGHLDVSPEGCLVIALVQQWLVRHLCKRLMQLMTSEALILHRNKIPFSYLKNYLNFHAHFSLRNVVENYRQAAESTKNDHPTCCTATKILCFTRSSPHVHQLPVEFPSSTLGINMEKRAKEVLKEIVFVETDKLVAYKISSILSQSTIQDLIRSFLDSGTAEVCLLVIDMQKITKEVVNHIRIMIEEAETLSDKQTTKVFVVLLHFSPSQMFKPCYPALFLSGWDHCYLDTIAHSTVKGMVDIRDWFWQCCFPQQSYRLEEDTLLQALTGILPQAIPVLVSRVVFGSRQHGLFNCSMTGLQRTEAVNEVLFKKRQDNVTVGRILCEKFRAYWKPSVMTEQLEKAATFSRNRESTLNITETIQTNFKNVFVDFLVYMISRINENYYLDILFDCSEDVQNVFLEILRIFPVPKFSQITLLSNNIPQPKPQSYVPKFPFFDVIFEIMEKIVEQSREEANIKLDILNEIPPQSCSISHNDVLVILQKIAMNRISEKMEGSTSKEILDVVAHGISNHAELWNRYFSDFVLHKLQLDSEDSSGIIAQKILHTTLMHQLHSLDALKRLVFLHTYLHVYQLDLARMAANLRPLSKLKELYKDATMPTSLLSPGPSSTRSLSAEAQHSFGSLEHLATFVVTTLFDALVGFLYPSDLFVESIHNNTNVWYNVFRDMMMLPNLKQCIYCSLGDPEGKMDTVEARLNLMQATFLTLQSSSDLTQDEDTVSKAQDIFKILFTRHFNESIELRTVCPRLGGIAEVALEIINCTPSVSSTSFNDWSESARVILEGLLAHFFSPERQHYNSEDIHWFLSLANCQTAWASSQLQDDCGDMSSDPSTDTHLTQSVDVNTTLKAKKPEVVSMNVFKLYLGKILGQFDAHSASTDSDPLQLYHPSPRNEIGVVLTSKEDLGPPGPFIPNFYMYKDCPVMVDSKHPCMQQPLAHLYFLTVLEHLLSKPYKLSELVILVSRFTSICTSEPTSNAVKAVLYIELQAVIQVIAQQLALHLDPTQPEKFGEVVVICDNLNSLLDDETTGGGKTGGHGMVVALHLFKLLKSYRQFTNLFLNMYDSVFRGIRCLDQFNEQLKKPPESYAHLLPFMMPKAEGEMATLYNQVTRVMTAIHKGNGSVTNLKQLAEEWANPRKRPKRNYPMSKTKYRRDWFRMVVWLVTYYEFFCKKKISKLLCDVMGSPAMLPHLKEKGCIRMIQCFLLPDLMVHQKEAPNVVPDIDQTISECVSDSSGQLQQQGKERDPVYELFMPTNQELMDQSDTDLCRSIANLVAIVMGCPPSSNHLWFHMFAPEKLINSYMTGFMYNSKVSPDGLQYDCGVELTAEGEFGRSDYLKHAGRGTYTLHSLYLILWANFGAFTMSLLTLPDADAQIHDNLLSEQLSIRHYCVSQLKALWQHMRNNLALSEEERIFFVNQCLKTFHEVVEDSCQENSQFKGCIQGIFATREELDDYERTWHLHIYKPNWGKLHDKFATDCFSLHQHQLFANLRCLDVRYPHFPSETEFMHYIISYGDLEQHSEGGELRVLSDFAQSWKVLQAGGLLLPDLMEFYRWLHTELAHLLTYEKAIAASILRVVQLAAKRYGPQRGENIMALYDRVKKGYNEYVEMIGGAIGAGACAALKQGNKIYTIADDVPLLHFLTDSEQEEEGNDWLFTVISHIVMTHNLAVERLYAMINSRDQFNLTKLLPDQPAKVLPTEVTDKNCFIGKLTNLHGISSFLQVIRSRYQPPSLKSSERVTQGRDISSPSPINNLPKFQLRYLEEDLVKLFSAGKPLIQSPSSIRILFKFKQSFNTDVTAPDNVIRVTLDMEGISSRLPEEYKKPLSNKIQKRLEYEFHSCGYSCLIMVTTALQTVCGHLKKVIMEDARSLNKEDLIDLSLPAFLMKNVYEPISDPQEVLSKIGIASNSLKHSQLACLIDLPLPATFYSLRLFVQWIHQGVYDFCNLPLALKAHLPEPDRIFLEQELRDQWTGTLEELEAEVKQMIEVLKHSENEITKRINEQAPRISIVQYLTTYLLVDETDKLPPLIPETVVLQHYVHFRLALQRLLMRLRAELKVYRSEGQGSWWSEFVADLWSVQLSHLHEEMIYEDFNPALGPYGFEGGSENVSDEGLSFDLENDQCEEEQVEDGVSIVGLAEEDSVAEQDEAQMTTSSGLGKPTIERETKPPIRNQNRTKDDLDNNEVLVSEARTYSPTDVGDFLCSIKLDRYRENFIDNEVSGDVLLDADCECLTEIGVESPLDRVRIKTLFPRHLLKAQPRYSVSEVLKFLSENNLRKYTKQLEENQIDGDMILNTEPGLMKQGLREIGIGVIDVNKIISKFKTYVSRST